MTGRPPDARAYAAAVRAGDRAGIARAITLIESTRPDHRAVALDLLTELGPHTGGSRRVGVTGVPGAGKSTFIDAVGSVLTGSGHRVAVLAVDPSSTRTGGSVLGDRTRMARLAADPAAFVRASCSGGVLGGVADRTSETILVMEAAGYDVVLVETVGTGQSELDVAGLVDVVLLVMVAGGGDGLQHIKMGVLEVADLIAVNKADGGGEAAAGELAGALRLVNGGRARTPVVTCSALTGAGLADVCARLREQHDGLLASGRLAARRRDQQVAQMWRAVRTTLLTEFNNDVAVAAAAVTLQAAVRSGELPPARAAERLVAAFRVEREVATP
ncbi:methylmalonyl Co-A mutase-associated GTPase MeaB [Micromonospora sp. NPDC051196]|uniref:methylmalonyl Co-A mutase-associated GTPase MeaB n=1 Tax=Micromonospora sp. NPDC051196 TaxID=3155281 RepID=UPI003414F3AF